MDGPIIPEAFLAIWSSASSPTEVSVRLRKAGYGLIGPDECVAIALGYALSRYDVKPLIQPNLPIYHDPDENLVTSQLAARPPQPNPALSAPDTVIECEVAAKHAAFERVQRQADPAYTIWHMNERWPFKPGSND